MILTEFGKFMKIGEAATPAERAATWKIENCASSLRLNNMLKPENYFQIRVAVGLTYLPTFRRRKNLRCRTDEPSHAWRQLNFRLSTLNYIS